MAATLQLGSDQYTVTCTIGELPAAYSSLIERATLHDDFGVDGAGGTVLVISVESADAQWPALVVSQRFEPGPEAGFHPAALLIPESHLLLLGAGTRLLAYDLRSVLRVWEDDAEVGFWGWKRHGEVVLMSAELELAAWDLQGDKLWSTFVEPPWTYEVHGARVELDVMGERSDFNVTTGPEPRDSEVTT